LFTLFHQRQPLELRLCGRFVAGRQYYEYREHMSIRLFTLILYALASLPVAAQSIPFEVCTESTIWVRPSPEVQAKIWNDGRYRDVGPNALAWTHNFIIIDDPQSASVPYHLMNESGLWTEPPETFKSCYSDEYHSRNGYEWIEVWSLLHRVTAVTRSANAYTVTVQPVTKGFQWIYIRRMNPSVVLRFVTPQGAELERWDESAPPR
jgi:hypothetical protein